MDEISRLVDDVAASLNGPGWGWVAAQLARLLERYPGGVTRALVAAELEAAWTAEARQAGDSLARLAAARDVPPSATVRLAVAVDKDAPLLHAADGVSFFASQRVAAFWAARPGSLVGRRLRVTCCEARRGGQGGGFALLPSEAAVPELDAAPPGADTFVVEAIGEPAAATLLPGHASQLDVRLSGGRTLALLDHQTPIARLLAVGETVLVHRPFEAPGGVLTLGSASVVAAVSCDDMWQPSGVGVSAAGGGGGAGGRVRFEVRLAAGVRDGAALCEVVRARDGDGGLLLDVSPGPVCVRVAGAEARRARRGHALLLLGVCTEADAAAAGGVRVTAAGAVNLSRLRALLRSPGVVAPPLRAAVLSAAWAAAWPTQWVHVECGGAVTVSGSSWECGRCAAAGRCGTGATREAFAPLRVVLDDGVEAREATCAPDVAAELLGAEPAEFAQLPLAAQAKELARVVAGGERLWTVTSAGEVAAVAGVSVVAACLGL